MFFHLDFGQKINECKFCIKQKLISSLFIGQIWPFFVFKTHYQCIFELCHLILLKYNFYH